MYVPSMTTQLLELLHANPRLTLRYQLHEFADVCDIVNALKATTVATVVNSHSERTIQTQEDDTPIGLRMVYFDVTPPVFCDAVEVLHIALIGSIVPLNYVEVRLSQDPSRLVCPLWEIKNCMYSGPEKAFADTLSPEELIEFGIWPGEVPQWPGKALTSKVRRIMGIVKRSTKNRKERVVVLTSSYTLAEELSGRLQLPLYEGTPACVCVDDMNTVVASLAQATLVIIADGLVNYRLLQALRESSRVNVIYVRAVVKLDYKLMDASMRYFFCTPIHTYLLLVDNNPEYCLNVRKITMAALLGTTALELHRVSDSCAVLPEAPAFLVHKATLNDICALLPAYVNVPVNLLNNLQPLLQFIHYAEKLPGTVDSEQLSAFLTFWLCKLMLDAVGVHAMHVLQQDDCFLLSLQHGVQRHCLGHMLLSSPFMRDDYTHYMSYAQC